MNVILIVYGHINIVLASYRPKAIYFYNPYR